MGITNRTELIQYCRRALGEPVINIEIDDDQVEDRIDDAIEFYQDIHYDGTEKIFLKHRVTGSFVEVSNSLLFRQGEEVLGNTSGSKFIVKSVTPTGLIFGGASEPLTVGETLIGQSTGAMGTLSAVTYGDMHNKWVTLPDEIIGITRVLPFKDRRSQNQNFLSYAFDPKYQLMVSELGNISNLSTVYYTQVMSHLSLLDKQLRPLDSARFNRRTGKVYLEFDWDILEPNDYIVFECFRAVDPESFPKIYNDRLFKEYAVALLKRQWGSNTKKFDGVQILGGIQIRGQDIFDEATKEIEMLEEKIRDRYELPPIGFMG
ncbi:hypothetical protein [Synechococcus phage BUCT-ZZ01]|nr:hypothetical protein [Synechococcus phage BUCT-ZZ01]